MEILEGIYHYVGGKEIENEEILNRGKLTGELEKKYIDHGLLFSGSKPQLYMCKHSSRKLCC